MERRVGTISRGIRCPIIREGDKGHNLKVMQIVEREWKLVWEEKITTKHIS